MGIKREYIALFSFCAILAALPVWGGRSFNGTSDFATGTIHTSNGLFTANLVGAAQGSLAFILNVTSVSSNPTCGISCGSIVELIGSRYSANSNSCLTVTGACLEIIVCNSTVCGTSGNAIDATITTPNVSTMSVIWDLPATGSPHQYTFLLNTTATAMQLYIDGVLQTHRVNNAGSPGPINYTATGCGGGGCPVTFMANSATARDNFAHGILSEVAIWNVTLSVSEIQSLVNCVPPNRIEPEHVVYWPLYGVDSTEPNYTPQKVGSPAVIVPQPLTLTGTTGIKVQAGCQAGGAYH